MVCIDFRDLNKATPKDKYLMPVAKMLVCQTTDLEYLIGKLASVLIFQCSKKGNFPKYRSQGLVDDIEFGLYLS